MTRTRGTTIFFACAALVAAAAFPSAARAECSLENVASPQEIAGGWTIHEDLRIVKQVDSAPYEQGGNGNWFVDRETTTVPMCSVFDDLGGYSLRSYMLQPVVTKSHVRICQATADGGSLRFVPADAKPRPADTAYEVYSPYNRPYAGSCPPVPPAPDHGAGPSPPLSTEPTGQGASGFTGAASAQVSPPASANLTINGKTISIHYSAPSVRGRRIFGDGGLLSTDPTYPAWRAGANAATSFHTDAALDIGGLAVPAGNYTLYIWVKDPNAWELIVNKQVGQWGLVYDAAQELGRVKMTMSKPPTLVETLKYVLTGRGAGHAELRIEWENHVAAVPVAVH